MTRARSSKKEMEPGNEKERTTEAKEFREQVSAASAQVDRKGDEGNTIARHGRT